MAWFSLCGKTVLSKIVWFFCWNLEKNHISVYFHLDKRSVMNYNKDDLTGLTDFAEHRGGM